jgi:hypothetical protein
MEIPLVYARVQGDTLKDLIEALSRLDPDTKTRVQEVQTRCTHLPEGAGFRELVLCLPNLDRITV